MRTALATAVALALLGLGSLAQAITIDTVRVGDPGNAADTRVMTQDGTTGYGSVGYAYNIGKYEVTAGQYTAFLNAVAETDTYGLYNRFMDTSVYSQGCNIKRTGTSGSYAYSVASDWANRPVNMVSYWDSCRFANWLGNGQKSGAQDLTTTEDGAYFLNGYTGGDGRTIQRKAGWSWAVTSEDEWYKAAYYKGGSANAGYALYPTQSSSTPGRDMADASGNNANYWTGNGYLIGSPYYRTEGGEFQNSDSAYGTFDQGGNVWEWNESILYINENYTVRCVRGGSYRDNGGFLAYTVGGLQSICRGACFSEDQEEFFGFRISQAVPEPSSIIALLGGLTALIGLRRRKA